MDHLWTPWRFQYITASGGDRCVFCCMWDEERDQDNLVLLRGSQSFVVLNKFPYTSGHVMVVARRHISTLSQATELEMSEIMASARRLEGALQALYRPDGFNIGFNLGKSAGAGVAGHLHLHIVPRWQGDANFVSVLGETRVIPEDLKVTYEKLSEYLGANPSASDRRR
jgi:ATP adenylyltransferase